MQVGEIFSYFVSRILFLFFRTISLIGEILNIVMLPAGIYADNFEVGLKITVILPIGV